MKGKKGYIYRIRMSGNMLRQCDEKLNKKEFETFDKAYNFICEKWGSAVLNDPLGLNIEKKKIGADEWAFCMGA
jgi:hypothetical protein